MMTDNWDRLAARMEAMEQRVSTSERRLDVIEQAGKHTAEKIDGLREFFSSQVQNIKDALAEDRKATQAEFASWRDNTRFLLRAILTAIITSMVLGLGGLIYTGALARANATEPEGTAALSSPLGADNDHTSFNLGAARGNRLPDFPASQ